MGTHSANIFLLVQCLCILITRCAYAQGRVKRLSPSLYRSASQFIFFERCLQSRTTLLSSAMAMVSNSCTAPRGIEHYGNWVCRPTTSLRERCEHTHGWRNVKSQQPAQFYRMTVLHAEPFNRLTYRPPHCLSAIASQTQLVLRVTKLRAVHV